MRQSTLLSTVLFRESRLMNKIPLGECLLIKATDRDADVLHDQLNNQARLTIDRMRNTYVMRFSPEGLVSTKLTRMINPVMRDIVGEVINSDEGVVLVLKSACEVVRKICGTQRELFIPNNHDLVVSVDKTSLKAIAIQTEPSGKYNRVH